MLSIVQSVYYSDDIVKTSKHYHDCHQIMLIQKGKISVSINESEYIACGGDLIILSRFENHAIKILSDCYERYILRITPNLAQNKEFLFLTMRPSGFANIVDVKEHFDIFKNLIDQIIMECKNSDLFTESIREHLISQLLLRICRISPEDIYKSKSKHSNLILSVKNDLENNCHQHQVLLHLAEKYYVSPSTLSHEFKKIVGVSVYEYLTSCRIAIAKKDLANTSKSISEIVGNCGFSDFSNFSRAFKQRQGITPSEFRKKYRIQ